MSSVWASLLICRWGSRTGHLQAQLCQLWQSAYLKFFSSEIQLAWKSMNLCYARQKCRELSFPRSFINQFSMWVAANLKYLGPPPIPPSQHPPVPGLYRELWVLPPGPQLKCTAFSAQRWEAESSLRSDTFPRMRRCSGSAGTGIGWVWHAQWARRAKQNGSSWRWALCSWPEFIHSPYYFLGWLEQTDRVA